MIWLYFSSAVPGPWEFVPGIMDQYVFQVILNRNGSKSAAKLRFWRRYTFQQDRDPKHSAKTTSEFFEKNKINVLE